MTKKEKCFKMLTIVNKKERDRVMISKSLENYVKTMYVLDKQTRNIRVTDIAQKMNCTKASVNKALKVLKENKLVEYETYGKITLTPEGEKLAKKLLEAYDIVYLFLTQILEMEEETAKAEAEHMKLSLEDYTINQLAKYTHKVLGLYPLNCGYDINNERCIVCPRRNPKHQGKERKSEV